MTWPLEAQPSAPSTGMTSLHSCIPGILKSQIIFPAPPPPTPGLFYAFWLLSVPIAKQREIQPESLDGVSG